MLKKVASPQKRGFLTQYQMPPLSFAAIESLPDPVRPIWDALATGNPSLAETRARHTLQEKRLFSASERAALKVGLAAAELYSGATAQARRHAGRALDLCPGQWSAHRILLTILSMQKAYKAAYLHLSNLDLSGPTPLWDEPLSDLDVSLSLASWAWMLGEWDTVAGHLTDAYPGGIEQMPAPILDDWFRLSLYRDNPDDAAAAAGLLIAERPAEVADELLQTFVQSGWTKQALPLYRVAYQRAPQSQLLRRRLVALCIREGQLEEARELARPGALSLAA